MLIIIFAWITLLSIPSCEIHYDNTVSTEQAINIMNQGAQGVTIFKDITNQITNIARYSDDSLLNRQISDSLIKDPYPSLSIEPFDNETWPKTITMNYGPVNHLCPDMRERRGKLIITATGLFENSGAEYTVSFENFYQSNYNIQGQLTITNLGKNDQDKTEYEISASGININTPDAKTFYYNQNNTRIWQEGEETPLNYEDDVYYVNGEQFGYSSDSVQYKMSISDKKPLDIWVKCRWIRAGVLNIDIETIPDISLDFGDGECNNYATATYDGEEYIINMD
ncbi:MAG: hypothetical protein PF590_03530 [Candidatus Delongbacteria bacterium]|nr:hypothetical protein [Candidatus Delongbacteria bacterium]